MLKWLFDTNKGRLCFFLAYPFLTSIWGFIIDWSTHGQLTMRSAMTFGISSLCVSVLLVILTKGKIWTPFMGYEMEANLKRIQQEAIPQQIDLQKEIEDWTRSMGGGFNVKKINEYKYRFRRKRDAMAFKLAWG